MQNVDADAILAEFARHPTPRAPRGGRRLDGAAVPSSHAADTDAAMKWMEARIDALAVEAAPSAAPAQPSARRGGPSARARAPPPDGGADIVALAQLEAQTRQVSAAVQAAQERALQLRARLERAGIDDGAIGRARQPAPAAPAAAPATVAVRSRRGSKERGGAATSASELADAAGRRAGMLRRQLPAARAQLEAVERECAQLAQLAADSGLSDSEPPAAPSASAAPTGRLPHPSALLAQLRALDEALRSTATAGNANNAGGRVHSLLDAPPLIPLTVFSDGFMLYRGPFRPMNEVSATLFAQQVMAGMVPNELQERFPDGFGLQLHDKTSTTHAHAHADAAATHVARAKGPAGARLRGLSDVGGGADALLAPQSAEQLLQRLPDNVVRDGNLLPVRSDVAELLGVGRRAAAAHGPADENDVQAVRAARLRRFGGGGPVSNI